ncbi:MAG: FlgB family protein [Albidovulum sp.]
MFDKPEILGMSAAMAANAATRMSAIAQNVANADTPGYRATDTADFAATYRSESGLRLAATRPGHFAATPANTLMATSERAGGHLSPNGNNVSLEDEMMRAAMVRKDHDMALAIYKKSLDILRLSLGRR